MSIVVLDVRDLEPPEPLERALAAAEALDPGGVIEMRHRREPCLLGPMLENKGFEQRIIERSADLFEIYIWRKGDAKASALVPEK